jgi:chromosome partitioning protein
LYDSRTKLGQEILEKIKEYFDVKVFNTPIRKNVKLSESPSHGMPVMAYAPDSNGARDYTALTKEIIAQEKSEANTEGEEASRFKEHAFK